MPVSLPPPSPDLAQLQALQFPQTQTLLLDISPIRKKAITEVALSIGAKAGLDRRSHEIQNDLESMAPALDKMFNFAPMLLPGNVLPPVIVDGKDNMKADGDSILRISEHVYRIEAGAKLVTSLPSWRNYLSFGGLQTRIEKPSDAVMPKTSQEKELWKQEVTEGWKLGVEQADSIYRTNLARLKRDFNGMILYRELLAAKMVSLPVVATANLGVTGNGKEMNVDDRIYRITVNPTLQTDASKWNAVIRNGQ